MVTDYTYISTGQHSSRERRQEKNFKDHEPIAVGLYTYVLAIHPFLYVPVVSITIVYLLATVCVSTFNTSYHFIYIITSSGMDHDISKLTAMYSVTAMYHTVN